MTYTIARYEERTIDANGEGIIQLGPKKVAERWDITSISTSSDSDTDTYTPKLEVFRNGHELVAGTWNANFDTAGGSIKLRQNEFIRCVLTGGEPGKRWTISVDGNGDAF